MWPKPALHRVYKYRIATWLLQDRYRVSLYVNGIVRVVVVKITQLWEVNRIWGRLVQRLSNAGLPLEVGGGSLL